MRRGDSELHAARLAKARSVLSAVERELGIPAAAVLGDSRQPDIAEARHEVMVRLWRQGMALSTIARTLGVHHTTVLSGIRRRIGMDVYKAESAGAGRVATRTRVA